MPLYRDARGRFTKDPTADPVPVPELPQPDGPAMDLGDRMADPSRSGVIAAGIIVLAAIIVLALLGIALA